MRLQNSVGFSLVCFLLYISWQRNVDHESRLKLEIWGKESTKPRNVKWLFLWNRDLDVRRLKAWPSFGCKLEQQRRRNLSEVVHLLCCGTGGVAPNETSLTLIEARGAKGIRKRVALFYAKQRNFFPLSEFDMTSLIVFASF